jgi:hypothetical protein
MQYQIRQEQGRLAMWFEKATVRSVLVITDSGHHIGQVRCID